MYRLGLSDADVMELGPFGTAIDFLPINTARSLPLEVIARKVKDALMRACQKTVHCPMYQDAIDQAMELNVSRGRAHSDDLRLRHLLDAQITCSDDASRDNAWHVSAKNLREGAERVTFDSPVLDGAVALQEIHQIVKAMGELGYKPASNPLLMPVAAMNPDFGAEDIKEIRRAALAVGQEYLNPTEDTGKDGEGYIQNIQITAHRAYKSGEGFIETEKDIGLHGIPKEFSTGSLLFRGSKLPENSETCPFSSLRSKYGISYASPSIKTALAYANGVAQQSETLFGTSDVDGYGIGYLTVYKTNQESSRIFTAGFVEDAIHPHGSLREKHGMVYNPTIKFQEWTYQANIPEAKKIGGQFGLETHTLPSDKILQQYLVLGNSVIPTDAISSDNLDKIHGHSYYSTANWFRSRSKEYQAAIQERYGSFSPGVKPIAGKFIDACGHELKTTFQQTLSSISGSMPNTPGLTSNSTPQSSH